MAQREDGGTNALLAFLLGGAVGGVLGLLYAPSSGEETRRKIKFYAEEASDKAAEKMQAARSESVAAYNRMKSEFAQKKDLFVSAIDAGRQAFQEEKDLLEENA